VRRYHGNVAERIGDRNVVLTGEKRQARMHRQLDNSEFSMSRQMTERKEVIAGLAHPTTRPPRGLDPIGQPSDVLSQARLLRRDASSESTHWALGTAARRKWRYDRGRHGAGSLSDPSTLSTIGPDSSPECTAVVDPPPPPRSAMSRASDQPSVATAEPTEHWRNTQATRLPRSQDLPLWDPPELALRAEIEDGSVAIALCTSDPCIATRWQGEGLIDPNETGARWQPTSRDDQITVCVRSEGGVAFATLRAADVRGFDTV
jgi:hypothetical protein